jgi:hypothetical protein
MPLIVSHGVTGSCGQHDLIRRDQLLWFTWCASKSGHSLPYISHETFPSLKLWNIIIVLLKQAIRMPCVVQLGCT